VIDDENQKPFAEKGHLNFTYTSIEPEKMREPNTFNVDLTAAILNAILRLID
jgi:hypothetical protein